MSDFSFVIDGHAVDRLLERCPSLASTRTEATEWMRANIKPPAFDLTQRVEALDGKLVAVFIPCRHADRNRWMLKTVWNRGIIR